MSRLARIVACLCVAAAAVGTVRAQQAVNVKRQARDKQLAYRAARVDGIRKLAQRINGLSITSETHVRDFVAESDTIKAAMMAMLIGVREKGEPRYRQDGTCSVTVEITLREAIAKLKTIHERHYEGDQVKATDFEKMLIAHQGKILTEVGNGAPRSEAWEQNQVASPLSEDAPLSSIKHMSGAARAFWLKYCTGRGRLVALREAHIDGTGRLAERIKGVWITSETTVQDFVAESNEIGVNMETFIRGARETGVRYHDNELIVEVEMSVKLRTVYLSLKTWGERHYKGDKGYIQQLEKLVVSAKDKAVKQTGMGVPPAKHLKTPPAEVLSVVSMAASAPPWATRHIKAVGQAKTDRATTNAQQAKRMAFGAAELDARRKLAEKIIGLMITANMSVTDFVAMNDQIGTSLLTYQQGSGVVKGSQKALGDGTVQVTVEIDLKPLWDLIIYYKRTLNLTIS